MPSALESLATVVHDPALEEQGAMRMERLRLQIADTVAMILEGGTLAEGKLAMAAGSHLVAWCACARLTEADDIHLTSCTTPGSVIVPAALHLAAAGAVRTWGDLVTAVLAGYEAMIRLGYAIDGPRVLARKIWPTLFAAPVGAAAVACRAWKLDGSQTAGALATALAASTGIAPPALTPNSSRCLSLGVAAERGVEAAMAARAGALGDVNLLERYGGRIAGVRISTRRLLRGAQARFLFDEIGLKPYPIARQALAAVEACKQLVGRKTSGITDILVSVPSAQARIIDHPCWPLNRMQSIASVQYQIALAVLAPEHQIDVARTPAFETPALRSFVERVRVHADARLDAFYPKTWPARVLVQRSRTRQSAFVENPRGDARNPMEWDDVIAKAPSYRALLTRLRTTDAQAPVPRDLLTALK